MPTESKRPFLSSQKGLARQIADHYRQMIQSGTLSSGQRLPTIRQLAKELDVSAGPANEAFRILEQEGLVYRRSGLGTFVGAWTPVLPPALDIGILFRTPREWTSTDNYVMEIFCGIQESLQKGKHRASLVTLPFEEHNLTAAPKHFLDSHVHGYILDEWVPDLVVKEVASAGGPVIVVNRGCDVAGVGSVFRDNRQAGALAARRIMASGHRVVVCIYREDWNGAEAASGFLETMSAAGAAVPAQRVGSCHYIRSPYEVTAEYLRRAVASAPVPTAIYCTDDGLAKLAYSTVQGSGLRIPEDVSVIGMLDLAMAAKMRPPLTTFRIDPAEIGRVAIADLVACCSEPGRTSHAHTITGEWVDRCSVAQVGQPLSLETGIIVHSEKEVIMRESVS